MSLCPPLCLCVVVCFLLYNRVCVRWAVIDCVVLSICLFFLVFGNCACVCLVRTNVSVRVFVMCVMTCYLLVCVCVRLWIC